MPHNSQVNMHPKFFQHRTELQAVLMNLTPIVKSHKADLCRPRRFFTGLGWNAPKRQVLFMTLYHLKLCRLLLQYKYLKPLTSRDCKASRHPSQLGLPRLHRERPGVKFNPKQKDSTLFHGTQEHLRA